MSVDGSWPGLFLPLLAPPPGLARPGRWYVVRDGEILVTDDGTPPVNGGPDPVGVVPDTPPVFLGVAVPGTIRPGDGPVGGAVSDPLPSSAQGCWAVGTGRLTPAPTTLRWAPLRSLAAGWSAEEWTVAGRAVQMVDWLRTNRFCGRCSTPTYRAGEDRSLRCGSCGLSAYPRLAPAVIVLVRRGPQALLAQGSRFRGRMFSTLAGFVEPGETLEQTVHREVLEEVGVTLHPPRYVASQPWPFPHSLMVGFTADWAGGTLAPDGEEILEARWWEADRLPPVPPRPSIARRLIDDWVAEVTGADPRLPPSP